MAAYKPGQNAGPVGSARSTALVLPKREATSRPKVPWRVFREFNAPGDSGTSGTCGLTLPVTPETDGQHRPAVDAESEQNRSHRRDDRSCPESTIKST
jgi:hypothetical protein